MATERQRGQTSVEYVGVIVVVGILVLALLRVVGPLGGDLVSHVESVVGFGGGPAGTERTTRPQASARPPSASQRGPARPAARPSFPGRRQAPPARPAGHYGGARRAGVDLSPYRNQRNQPGGAPSTSRVPAEEGTYKPAGNNGRVRRQPQAERDYNAPAVSGRGSSRGSSPPNYEPSGRPSQDASPGRRSVAEMQSLPSNNRPLQSGRAGRYPNPPGVRPFTDSWPLDRLGRSTGSRIRGVDRLTLDNVKTAPGNAGRATTDAAKSKMEGLKGRFVRKNGRCEPLQASHLVAASLGGPGDDPRNLVAMTRGDNLRMYNQVEKDAASIIRANPNAKFTYYAKPSYAGASQYPSSIDITLEVVGGKMENGQTTGLKRYHSFVPSEKSLVSTTPC